MVFLATLRSTWKKRGKATREGEAVVNMLIYKTSLVSESKNGGTADARERNVFASKQICMSWLVTHYTCGRLLGTKW